MHNRSFKVSYAKRNYRIDDIIFDRSPKTQTFNYEGKTINLIDYYEIAHNIKESENIIINFIIEPNENIKILNK